MVGSYVGLHNAKRLVILKQQQMPRALLHYPIMGKHVDVYPEKYKNVISHEH